MGSPEEVRTSRAELAWLAVPLLFAAYRPIGFFAVNVDQMTVGDLFSTLGIALGAAVVLTGLAYAGLRKVVPAAVSVSLLFAAFYSYGVVYDAAAGAKLRTIRRLGEAGFTLERMLIGVALALVALVAWWLTREKAPGAETVRIAAAIGATLLVLSTYNAVTAYWSASRAEALSGGAGDGAGSPATRGKAAATDPDIYYIVLDRYLRHDALLELTGHDNQAFLDSLRERGFFVQDKAISNYSITYTSLASTLNMRYLDDYLNLPGYESKTGDKQVNRKVLYDLIGRSEVAKRLQQRGYTYVHISSGWAATADSPMADRVVNTSVNDEYRVGFLTSTAARSTVEGSSKRNHRERVSTAFAALTQVKDTERPAFVFAHILAPHPPYVFAKDGSDPRYDEAELARDKRLEVKAFGEQTAYIDGVVLDLVDKLQRDRKRPMVIIVQSDHGAVYRPDWLPNGEKINHLRKHAILSAVYSSEGTPPEFQKALSPVNTFRILFDRDFGTRMGLLPDKAFYSSTETWPYWPSNVTSDVVGATR